MAYAVSKNLDVKTRIRSAAQDAVRAAEQLCSSEGLAFIENAARSLVQCYRQGKKVIVAGNGGSLCDAMHFAEELTGQFRESRPALAAIALGDASHMSCVANDFGFESVFSRGVEALGSSGDVFVALSTSGNSVNLIKAVETAKTRGMKTIGFLGKTGGKLKGMCDLEWIVSGFSFSDRIQEAHMAAIHIVIELVEFKMFYADAPSR